MFLSFYDFILIHSSRQKHKFIYLFLEILSTNGRKAIGQRGNTYCEVFVRAVKM